MSARGGDRGGVEQSAPSAMSATAGQLSVKMSAIFSEILRIAALPSSTAYWSNFLSRRGRSLRE